MGWKMLVSYLWGSRDYSLKDKESIYSYLNPDHTPLNPKLSQFRPTPRSAPVRHGYVLRQGSGYALRPGSPAFRRKGRLKRQGSVSPKSLNSSTAASRLRTTPPGPGALKARGGIPVRSSTAFGGDTTPRGSYSTAYGGDSTPRSSSSKESTPSPAHSPRNSVLGSRIPISRSQEDLIKSVHARSRSTAPETTSPSTSSQEGSNRNSRLLSASSVEVLSSQDSSQAQISCGGKPSEGSSGQSTPVSRPAPPPKPSALNKPGSRIPPPASRRTTPNKPSTSYGSARARSSTPSSPRTQRAADKLKGPVGLTSPRPIRGRQLNSSGGHLYNGSGQLNGTGQLNNSSGQLNNGGGNFNNSGQNLSPKHAARTMIGETKRAETFSKTNAKRKLLKVEAEKVLKEQLSRGKVPPKAKFRADDEISIGEPADSRVAGSTLSSPRVGLSAGLASPRVGLSGGLSRPRVGSSGGLSSPRIGLSPRVQELKVRQANTPTTLPSEDNPPQPAGDFSVEKQTPETERAGRINPPETERAPRVNSLPLTPAHRNLLAKGVVAKSASLDHHYRPTSETPKQTKALSARGSSSNFFQRISNLRQSFSERRSPSKITPHTTSTDTGFFQGISERKYTLTANDNVKHGLVLAIPPIVKAPPPRRKRPRRVPPPLAGNKRSYSFTDAQFIAQAVTEGDNRFMDEFYPNFPVSDKIYSGIKARKVEAEVKMVKPSFMAERTNLERPSLPQKTVISVGKENIKGEIDLRLEARTPELSTTTTSDNKNLYTSNKNQTPSSINFYSPQEPSPIISPWGRSSTTSLVRTSTTTSIQSTSGTSTSIQSGGTNSEKRQRRVTSPVINRPDNVVLVECNGNPEEEEAGSLHRGIGPNHPFIRRVTSRSVAAANLGPHGHLVISTAEDNTASNNNSSSPDPFSNIISLADSNISQAESILSSLGCQRTSGLLPGASDRLSRRSGHEFSPGLSSDIESNIRKLERTQAKINAALENIRTVQNTNNRVVSSSPRVLATTLDNAELFTSNLSTSGNRRDARHRVTYPQSGVELKSNPRKEDAGPPEPLGELKLRKTSLFRRHSFNQTHKDKPQAKPESFDSQRDSSVWSDADSARSSAIYDDCAFSDSEGSFSPLKNRIRGLLGSFGKGKKKLTKSPKKRPEVSMRDPMDCPSDMSESLSIGQFTELVKNLPANSFNSKSGDSMSASPSFLRPKNPRPHRVVAQNNSNDTFSSASTNQSFSNRNSVISAASISSESFDNDNNSASDEAGTSTSSPHQPSNDDLTPAQRQERKLFFIAREIMSSERVYVDVLRLLNTEFREYVQKARHESKSGIMPDTDFVKLFSNLPELMMLNEDLLRDFEERVENWSKVKKIADVIVKKGPYLKLYTVFIRDFSAMNFHFEECCSRYPKFAKLVKEFEKMPRCQHLRLQHYMLKPVQRLPQYKLLLEDYLKHLEAEAEDFDDTTQALRIVSEAAEHANNTVKQGDKFQRMLRLQSRLGDWELIRPGRELVKEGELHKISRKGVGSRYFILLSDSLLYTSYQGAWAGDNTSLKVTYSIMLNQLSVNLSPCQDREYSTEFSITSNVRSCTLRAKDVRERNDWLDALSTAIEDYRSRKATFQTGEGEGAMPPAPGSLGESAPVWIPDQRVTMCQVCGSEFSLVVRRHHCRGCGAVVCTACSRNKAPLKYKCWEPHRVCDACFDSLEKQHGNDEDLRPRFKKRDQSRHATKYIPQRLKLNANSEGSQMSGHLRRRGRGGGKWKRHWFVLKDRVLYTYKASEDTVAVETFPVLGWGLKEECQGCDLPEGVGPELSFQLVHPNSENIVFVAETEQSTEAWLKYIRESLTL